MKTNIGSSVGQKGIVNLLIDLNGTCHVGEQPTTMAVEALAKLRNLQRSPSSDNRIRIRFCSNTTKESTSSLLAKLRRVGFTPDLLDEADLCTSLDATSRYVARSQLSPLLLLSSSAQSAFKKDDTVAKRCFFAEASQPPDQLTDAQVAHLRRCNAVVIGLCPELMTQPWLDEAFRLVSGEYGGKAQLIATHRAMYHRPKESSPLSLGPGAFITALESAARLDASKTVVCGKPSQEFLTACLQDMSLGAADNGTPHVQSERTVIIGDDVDADLGGGTVQLGLERVLVQTGKYREGDEKRTDPPPSQTFESFAHWVDEFVKGDP